MNNEKEKLLNIQLVGTIGFIIALLISYSLTLDRKLQLEGKKGLYTNKEAQDLALFQSVLILVVASSFLYTNYNNYKIAHINHEQNENDLILQTMVSIVAIISSLVNFYIVTKNYNGNLTTSETEII